jgi:hypothetical protein
MIFFRTSVLVICFVYSMAFLYSGRAQIQQHVGEGFHMGFSGLKHELVTLKGSNNGVLSVLGRSGWHMLRSKKTGKVVMMWGAPVPTIKGDAGEVSRNFVMNLKGSFGLSAKDGVSVKKVYRFKGRDHVRLQQTYGGIPVQGAQILVHLNPEGNITMIQNGSVAGISPLNKPEISRQDAENIALDALLKGLGQQPSLRPPVSELLLVPIKGNYYHPKLCVKE